MITCSRKSLVSLCLWIACGDRLLAQPSAISELFGSRDLNRCGPLALQACASFLQVPTTAREINSKVRGDGEVTTFAELKRAAASADLVALPTCLNHAPLLPPGTAAILAVKSRGAPHFIAACGRRGDRLLVIDFPNALWMDLRRLRGEFDWKGEALYISPNALNLAPIYALVYWKSVLLAFVTLLLSIRVFKRGGRLRSKRGAGAIRHGKTTRLASSCLIALTTAAASCSGCGAGSDSLIELQPKELTVEAARSGEEALRREIEIRIVNRSPQHYRLREVTTTCGCALVDKPDKTSLEPGEELPITVRLQLPSVGEKRSRVDFALEGAISGERRMSTVITMRGQPISAPAVVDTPRNAVLRVAHDGTADALVHVRTYERSDAPNWLSSADPDQNALTVEFLNVAQGPTAMPDVVTRTYWYRLKTRPEHLTGGVTRNVTVVLNSTAPAQAAARFYVRIVKWEPLRVTPEALFVALDGPARIITREIRVAFPDPRFRPSMFDVRSKDPWIEVESVTPPQNARCEGNATIKLRPNRESMEPLRAALVVSASDAITTVEKAVRVVAK